jgi:hypothetical protein
MPTKSTYGLRIDQMKSLFFMGAKELDLTDERDDNERMASLLQEQLTRALPRGSLLLDALFMMLDRQGCDTRPLAGRSLGSVFLNPQTDVRLLEAIKDCSKELSCALDAEAERALATTLYFAALASALVHHGKKITQKACEKLDESFALLTAKKWMAQELVELFSNARSICAAEKSRE